MATIEKRRDGYRVRWRDPDGSARSRQCPTKKVAEQHRRQVEDASALGRRWEPPARVTIPSLAELVDTYLVALCRTAAQNTIDSHRAQLAGFVVWCHEHGHADATALRRGLVEGYDAHRATLGLRTSTRRVTLSILSACWRWCYEHEDYRGHVAPPVRVSMPARVVHEVTAPLWSEVDAVVERALDRAATSRADIWRAIARLVVLLRGTGLRLSQCLRLEGRDVDAQLGTLRIRPELGKTSSERAGRTLPLPPWLLVELVSWDLDPGLIVTVPARGRAGVPDGTPSPLPASTGAWRVSQLWRDVDVDGRPVRPEVYERRPDHAFRKALRTELLHARCHPEAIEYWCGRSTGVRGTYTDPRAHDLLQIARAIPRPECVPSVSRGEVATIAQPLRKRA